VKVPATRTPVSPGENKESGETKELMDNVNAAYWGESSTKCEEKTEEKGGYNLSSADAIQWLQFEDWGGTAGTGDLSKKGRKDKKIAKGKKYQPDKKIISMKTPLKQGMTRRNSIEEKTE